MISSFQPDHADRFSLFLDSDLPKPTLTSEKFLNPKSKIQSLKSQDFVVLPEPGLPNVPKGKGDRELLYVLVIGSEAGVLETLYELQQRGFANVTDWSRNLPSPRELPQPRSGEVMRVLQRYRLRGVT